ncbi:serine hydrolase [Kineococcus sp. R8]|uniref:serine hydrolase n=1 Tax=Kineococcus siccus TaxID=2696567 RepID=UPI001411FF89|nr:serine hydrolase [Kineococcus siccus]
MSREQHTAALPPEEWPQALHLLDAPAALSVRDARGAVRTWARGSSADGRAVTTADVQYAASVAKQFTAALLARAVLDGLVREDTGVRSVLPRLPAWAADVTVHDLVHHTAGLPTTEAVTAAAGCAEGELDDERVLDALTLIDRPQQPPGRGFSYSNTGYVLLAEVLRRVSGTGLETLARAWLFEPLGLTSARWGGPAPATAPGRPRPPATTGDGGLWLSTDDLLRWLIALDDETLGADLTRSMLRPGLLRDGATVPYAWGTTARVHPRGTQFTHGGDWPGWTAKTVRQPGTGIAVALMRHGAEAAAVSRAALDVAERLLTTDVRVDGNRARPVTLTPVVSA